MWWLRFILSSLRQFDKWKKTTNNAGLCDGIPINPKWPTKCWKPKFQYVNTSTEKKENNKQIIISKMFRANRHSERPTSHSTAVPSRCVALYTYIFMCVQCTYREHTVTNRSLPHDTFRFYIIIKSSFLFIYFESFAALVHCTLSRLFFVCANSIPWIYRMLGDFVCFAFTATNRQ